MTFNYFIKRIINDKIKLIFIILILFIPIGDIFFYLQNIQLGALIYKPDMATFLTGNTIGYSHILQSILLWFLPLYICVIICDNGIEDYITGYKNILITKYGKKKYLFKYCKFSFLISFFIILFSLLINFILVHICLSGGQFSPSSESMFSGLQLYLYKHASLTNIIYIVIASFLYSILAITGTLLGIIIHDRKIVYPLTFLIWFIPLLMRNSLLHSIQPFTEYSLIHALPTLLLYLLINFLLIFILLFKEMKYAKV